MQNKGIRIQKVLSDNGILSRRKAEEYIAQGRITVNGRPAKVGHAVNPAKDIIAVDGKNVTLQRRKQNLYIMLYKPRGYVTTLSDELGRRCVAELVEDTPVKVYPVGRLDKDSEGLLLLTNDGEFANTVMHPSSHIAKTYRVTVRPDVTEDQLIHLSTGVEIDGKKTLPAQVHVLTKEAGRVVLQMTIYEGRNRQIRKMCEGVGLEVARLKRTSIGPLRLGMLAPGEYRELKPLELSALRGAVSKSTEPYLGDGPAPAKAADDRKPARDGQRPRQPLGKGGAPDKGPRKPYGGKPSGTGGPAGGPGPKGKFSGKPKKPFTDR